VGPRAGSDDMEKWKFLTLPGLEFRPLGRYTDYDIPAPTCISCGENKLNLLTHFKDIMFVSLGSSIRGGTSLNFAALTRMTRVSICKGYDYGIN
jgi:hypothetical protein